MPNILEEHFAWNIYASIVQKHKLQYIKLKYIFFVSYFSYHTRGK